MIRNIAGQQCGCGREHRDTVPGVCCFSASIWADEMEKLPRNGTSLHTEVLDSVTIASVSEHSDFQKSLGKS